MESISLVLKVVEGNFGVPKHNIDDIDRDPPGNVKSMRIAGGA